MFIICYVLVATTAVVIVIAATAVVIDANVAAGAATAATAVATVVSPNVTRVHTRSRVSTLPVIVASTTRCESERHYVVATDEFGLLFAAAALTNRKRV